MSLVLERRASKDEILELYLNEIYLGQRGSFAIHGVAEASRLFFGKDVANLTVGEAALIAGVIQNPGLHSPFANPKHAVERRNVVLRAMADEEYIAEDVADRAIASRSRSPLGASTTRRVLRRHGRPGDRGEVSRPHGAGELRRRAHDARHQPASSRSTRCATG